MRSTFLNVDSSASRKFFAHRIIGSILRINIKLSDLWGDTGGILDLTDNGLADIFLADGLLSFELFELFDD